jgi:hypothetical protein
VTHSTGAASPSNVDQDTVGTAQASVRCVSQPQTVESAAADIHQQPEIKREFYATIDVVQGIDLAI